MLSEKQMERLLEVFQKRAQSVTNAYLKEMGAHIKDIGQLIPSDVSRLVEMRRMNANLADIRRKIARAAEMSLDDLDEVFRAVAESDLRFARQFDPQGGQPTLRTNAALRRILRAQFRVAMGAMDNLSQTTVRSDAYRNAVDKAVQAVQSGVSDYNTAIRRALREAGQEGLQVTYPNSGLHRRLDTAIRQNILDGVRSLNAAALEEIGQEYGANGVEISAHALCAEDHLPYQGRQYTHEQFAAIQQSLKRPFGMWNCKHTMFPIVMGINRPRYSGEQLAEMERLSTEEIEISGVKKTRYEWSQEQRRMETEIRRQKDIRTLATAARDKDLRQEAQGRITQLEGAYDAISAAARIGTQWERTGRDGLRGGTTIGEEIAKQVEGTVTADGITAHMTIHLAGRVTSRNVGAEGIIQALTKPLDIGKIKIDEYGRPSKPYIGRYATVAVNPETGHVTTIWQTGRRILRKYGVSV